MASSPSSATDPVARVRVVTTAVVDVAISEEDVAVVTGVEEAVAKAEAALAAVERGEAESSREPTVFIRLPASEHLNSASLQSGDGGVADQIFRRGYLRGAKRLDLPGSYS